MKNYTRKVIHRLKTGRFQKYHLSVGVIKENADRKEGDINNAVLAYIQENGTNTIPPRPFMRSAFEAALDEVKLKNYDWGRYLDKLGKVSVKKMREEIYGGIPPPLADETLELRLQNPDLSPLARSLTHEEISARAMGAPHSMHAIPLIATGQLYNSLGYTVEKTKI